MPALPAGTKQAEIMIFDLTGRKIRSQNLTAAGSDMTVDLNISNIEPGIYLTGIIDENNKKSRFVKLVIQ